MGHSAYSSSADSGSPHVALLAACGSGVDPMGGHAPAGDSKKRIRTWREFSFPVAEGFELCKRVGVDAPGDGALFGDFGSFVEDGVVVIAV